jgi:hypothetical protein
MGAGAKGTTLVDVVIAASLLLVVFGLAIPGMKLAEDTISTGGSRDLLERAGDRILAEVVSILRSGRIVSIAPPSEPPELTVCRVRSDIDLGELTVDTPDVYESEPVVISFRVARTLDESEVRTDLNRDGDLGDTFALGTIEVSTAEGMRTLVSRPIVLLALPSYDADLDGDGHEDPLFAFDGATASVNLHLVQLQAGGRLLATSLRGSVKPRNRQEVAR